MGVTVPEGPAEREHGSDSRAGRGITEHDGERLTRSVNRQRSADVGASLRIATASEPSQPPLVAFSCRRSTADLLDQVQLLEAVKTASVAINAGAQPDETMAKGAVRAARPAAAELGRQHTANAPLGPGSVHRKAMVRQRRRPRHAEDRLQRCHLRQSVILRKCPLQEDGIIK